MAVPLRFTIAKLPEGSQMTPQQMLDYIQENLKGYYDGAGVAGQIGGNRPVEDSGIFFDIDGRNIEGFDSSIGTEGEYVSITGVPIGAMLPYAGSEDVSIPTNFLLCDGDEVSQETYALLYEVIGDTWGTAGSGNFRLPDLRNRVPVGTGEGEEKAGTYNAGGKSGIPGAMRELSVGEYIGSEGLQNIPKPLGGPSSGEQLRGRVSLTHDNKTNMTSTQQPGGVVRWIIRYR